MRAAKLKESWICVAAANQRRPSCSQSMLQGRAAQTLTPDTFSWVMAYLTLSSVWVAPREIVNGFTPLAFMCILNTCNDTHGNTEPYAQPRTWTNAV